MGRELKRKQAKREGKNVKELQVKKQDFNTMKPKTLVIIVAVILVLFIVLYLLTSIFVTKDFGTNKKNNSSDNKEATTITNKILAGDSLRQVEELYYVYYYDSTNEDKEVSSIVSSLNDKVYRVDLHDDFNSNFVGEPSGAVSDISSLKVSDPTVIKVESEKITNFYNGKEEIQIGLK